MLQGVLAVLRHESGDAVLLFAGETVLLLRREGQLYLDSSTGLWNEERLELVGMPYALRSSRPLKRMSTESRIPKPAKENCEGLQDP